ncbi:family 78 glycoside hydrolase catalytic domain [Paenibacillus qinlingensis]|nr:family 78 glycoside hydrolase catalytic domain [Paenibacillus qinlingensis]NQX58100.1 family 78 glycoside hydrolase catalytic domain [Paenibacillus qinlingensis]
MTQAWQADWLTDRAFINLDKSYLYHKELETVVIEPYIPDLQHHHWYVRNVCMLDDKMMNEDQIWLQLTADDYYKLYINGEFVAQGPAQSDANHYYYNRIDVRSFLKVGKNVIAVHVYYQGLLNRVYNSADNRQGLIAELWAGENLLVKTDRTWKVKRINDNRPGVTFGYDTQFTEHVDARQTERGWTEVGYDDSDWEQAEAAEHTDYTFVQQPTPLLAVYKKQPTHVERLAPGHYLIDFGGELTGQFAMNAHGIAGDQVHIFSGEELLPGDNAVRYDMRCNCLYHDQWTLSGDLDVFETYDYKAFRYVEVKGPEEALRPDSFHAVVRHYPFDEQSCVLHSSDELMNQIFDICKNGVRYGSQENFVDCPSREKGQYLGDNTIIGHSHMLLSGDLRLYRKAIEQFGRSSFVCEGLMAVVPGHFMQEIADFSLQWPMQVMQYYRYSGDMAFLQEMYPYAAGLLKHFEQFEREDGLLEGVTDKWNLVDWPQGLRDNYDFELSRPVGPGCHNVINALYIGCVSTVNEIRELLEITYEDQLPRLKKSFLEAFYDEKNGLFRDSEQSTHHALHANVLPMLFHIAPQQAVSTIVDMIRTKRFACGVYFSYFVMKALALVEEHELIYDLLSADDEHSWGNMIKEGATTCFEAWGKDQKWNTSLCHPWASGPVPLLIEDIIGLKPAKPGWQEIAFCPKLPASWTSFTLQLNVPTGTIQLRYENGEWTESFPPGIPVIR